MSLFVRRKADYKSASEYLEHHYEILETIGALPLADEPFVSLWQEGSGREALIILADEMKLPAYRWSWDNMGAISISFAQTMGGRLPVISTQSHKDFRQMDALINGREEARELPLTVNAFAMEARAKSIFRHRVLLLNRALRLRHECAHYETLRLLSGMKNHAHDEILADALGQIAAFGDFSAERQRLFFGLKRGKNTCHGRLSFYCQQIMPEEREKVYRAVDAALDSIEEQLASLLAKTVDELEIFMALAGTSIAERML